MENQYASRKESQASLRDFLTIMFKNRVIILSVFSVIFVGVTLVTFLLPPVYEAKSTLLVKFGREYIYHPEVGDMTPMVTFNEEEVINSEIKILTSRDLIEKVITTLKPENFYWNLVENPFSTTKPFDAALLGFEKKLTVEGVKRSNVIEVSLQGYDPQVVARAVNLLVALFKDKHVQLHSTLQSSFLEKQLATYEQKLSQSEIGLEGFKQTNRVFSLDEQRSLLLRQRSDLDTALKNGINTVAELQKRLVSLKGLKAGVFADKSLYTTSERDKIIVDARSKLLSLQLEEQELLKKYKEENRLVQHVRNEITMVKGFLADQEVSISGKVRTGNVVYQETEKERVKTEADLSAQRAKVDTLKGQVAQLDGELMALDRREKELQGLKREVTTNEKNYRTYVDRLEESRISDDMNRQKMANISVIQYAAPPIKPVKPRKGLNLALGIIFGLFSGIGAAFLAEYATQVMSTPASVEKRLGLPVLVTIELKK